MNGPLVSLIGTPAFIDAPTLSRMASVFLITLADFVKLLRILICIYVLLLNTMI